MNTIRNYLDNMFLGLPLTDDVIRAKKELLAMMEDKYTELKSNGKTENESIGIVISEFGNLDELGDTLGIKYAIENKTEIPKISYEEAKKYIEDSKNITPKTALGVFLCIMSPTILLLLLGISELGIVSVKEELLVAVGLVALIGMVALGVSYFLRFSTKLEKYEYLQVETFELDYKTEQMVQSIKEQDEPSYNSGVSKSVVGYILSVLPLIIMPLIFEEIEGLSIISVVVTLTIVALSTYNIIVKCSINDACKVLLQEGDYAVKNKSKTYQTISKIYWSVVVAIYLGYSFITNNWATSWIIWPVSGVLFGVIKAITDLKS